MNPVWNDPAKLDLAGCPSASPSHGHTEGPACSFLIVGTSDRSVNLGQLEAEEVLRAVPDGPTGDLPTLHHPERGLGAEADVRGNGGEVDPWLWDGRGTGRGQFVVHDRDPGVWRLGR
jgi:hypothetical protein